ncbi:MAG: hypothetical protein AAB334_02845 [Patescibacteria group bacterium]
MKKIQNIASAVFMFAGTIISFIMTWTVIDEAGWQVSSPFVFWGMAHYGGFFLATVIMTAVFVRKAVA